MTTLDDALEEVRGLTTSGTEVFWLSREGVYGQSKTTSSKVSDPQVGLISPPHSLDSGSDLKDFLQFYLYTCPDSSRKVAFTN